MENTAFTCPHCGKTLMLPEDLTEFSCMYCGARMTREAPDPEGSREAAAVLLEALPGMITGYPKTMGNLTAGRFPAYFEAYVAQHGPVLELADSLCEDAIAPLCGDIINLVCDHIEAKKTALCGVSSLVDQFKFTLCLVTIPALRQCAPKQGFTLSEALRAAWIARFPDSTFQLATYEDIAQGFRKRGLCFITTAACRHLGKADDCAELTAFRHFRDTWLAEQPQGKALIEEYYRIAPAIVTAMDFGTNPQETYLTLWHQYLAPCYEALQRRDQTACFTRYTAMVQALKAQYLPAL